MTPTPLAPATNRAFLPWPDAVAEVCARPDLVRPVFQPIVDLQRGAVSGFEMLARFPSRGASPPEWFAAAREHGVGDLLEARLLRTGLATREVLPPNCFLTVNLSPQAAVSDEVAVVLDEVGRLDLVVIEITEQSAVEDYGRLGSVLDRLRYEGAAIAVDDAGAGYASLQHIMRLRPEFIKLDRELVAGLDTDPPKAALVEAVGSFASRIDAWLVAEGIERRGELDALRALRVPLGQGFGLGRPDPGFAAAPGDLLPGLALRVRGERPAGGLVTALEHPVTARAGDDPAMLDAPYTPVLDASERPVALLAQEPRRPVTTLLRFLLDEAPADLARRAMTRPAADRLTPLVCCDERGRYRGLLSVEHLVGHLSDAVDHHERTHS